MCWVLFSPQVVCVAWMLCKRERERGHFECGLNFVCHYLQKQIPLEFCGGTIVAQVLSGTSGHDLE